LVIIGLDLVVMLFILCNQTYRPSVICQRLDARRPFISILSKERMLQKGNWCQKICIYGQKMPSARYLCGQLPALSPITSKLQ